MRQTVAAIRVTSTHALGVLCLCVPNNIRGRWPVGLTTRVDFWHWCINECCSMKTSDPASESGEKPNNASLGVQMSFSASVATLCLLSGFFALHNPIHLFNKDSVLNMYKQTRTMHYTTNPNAQQWTSLLTTVQYSNCNWYILVAEFCCIMFIEIIIASFQMQRVLK